MTWQPNKWQQAVLRVYGDGDYRWFVDKIDDEEPPVWADESDFDDFVSEHAGDTLLVFLMRELGSDVHGDDPDEAARLVERAIEDLEGILPVVKLTR